MAVTGRTGATPPDLTRVRPYGDTLDDGAVQLSFSLPVPFGDEAKEAAKQMVLKMGLLDPQVYHAKDLGEGYSFFIIYARTTQAVDFTTITVPKVEGETMTRTEVNAFISEQIGRKIVVLGATTGTDAHTVGIDAIMNIKGYDHEKGLESYPMVEAYNLGAQVANEDLIKRAIELNADALLVSQVVTQKDSHKITLGQLIDMLEAAGLREKLVVVCGGPRVSHELALELGYDAGFGSGTLAPGVASFVATQMVERGLS
ncbi:MAG: beta-lysine 5,6-aminomutase beta subunit [Bradymonadia bacterium]|jgi:beta-lysine 5,6-aminomutase beta subunit